jgi:hypothetical protein
VESAQLSHDVATVRGVPRGEVVRVPDKHARVNLRRKLDRS